MQLHSLLIGITHTVCMPTGRHCSRAYELAAVLPLLAQMEDPAAAAAAARDMAFRTQAYQGAIAR